ncbi:MAG: hypothetical protein ABH874_04540 [Methanobacteriota archaeon]
MQVFKSKVRKIGNAEGVLIPREILKKLGVAEGDIIQLSAIPPQAARGRALMEMVGIFKGKKPFKRDWKDRF